MQQRCNSIKTYHVYFWCLHDFDILGCACLITSPVINGFHNMIVVFFSLALKDSSLFSTDSSPVSTDSSLLAFLLLEPSLLQSKSTLVNEMCIVLYFEIILLHFIWNKYFLIKKNIYKFSEQISSWKNTVDTNPRLPHLISMPQVVDGPEIYGNPTVYIGDLTFEIHARAVCHVIFQHRRELPLEQN